MRYKSAIKALLLIIVVASVAFLGIQEVRQRAQQPVAAAVATPPVEPVSSAAAGDGGSSEQSRTRKVIAFYFHVTYRCYTCRRIETLSEEALKQGFPGAFKEGVLEWRPVNVQMSENRHFIEDYRLFTKSLVLVRMKDGRQVEWKNLEKVWELVGRKEAFLRYVQDEVRNYLEKQ